MEPKTETLVKWLNTLLVAPQATVARRIDAGLLLLTYYRREKSAAAAGSKAKEEIQTDLARIRSTLIDLALDDDADLEQRLHAAAGAL